MILLATHAVGRWGQDTLVEMKQLPAGCHTKVQATKGAGNDSYSFAPGLEGGCLQSCLKGPSPTHSSIIWTVS